MARIRRTRSASAKALPHLSAVARIRRPSEAAPEGDLLPVGGKESHALVRHRHISWGRQLPTLALDGPSRAAPSRMANALRYLDLALLAVALPVFIAADFPMAGYLAIAGTWIVIY